MINIFYGRENLNKEKFMYDQIAKQGKKAIVLVPDQYTLEGEKQAFEYLQTKGLMDVQILPFSHFGDKILNKFGGSDLEYINDYGRHIILTKVMKKLENEGMLYVYAGQARKQSFIQLVRDFIEDVKKYQASIDVLETIIQGINDNETLKQKLTELYLIAQEYEKAIEGKYTDSNDKIRLIIDKIKLSEHIKKSHVWIYGFDTLTPNYLHIISELALNAQTVNVVLTYDDKCSESDVFNATVKTFKDFDFLAEEEGHIIQKNQIPASYKRNYENEDIAKVEQMFAENIKKISGVKNIDLIKSANPYNEAETAACYVLKLLKEKNYRLNDVVIVCNDPDKGPSIIDRVFQEYGIKLFLDKKKKLIESNITVFILSLLNSINNGYRTRDILEALKCGFLDLTEDEVEDLENYVFKYKIKGSMWKNPFKFGEKEYHEKKFAELNQLRERVNSQLSGLEDIVNNSVTIKGFIESFYEYLKDKINLPSKIENVREKQEKMGRKGIEFAEITAQIWNSFVSILEQIAALSGENEFEFSELIDMLQIGLENVEISMLPPTIDGITLVTTQRSRIAKAKAVLVLGANDGILPLSKSEDYLFTNEEEEKFAELGGQITKLDRVMTDEENLAIYKLLSLPSEKLFISSCAADICGELAVESPVFTQIKETFIDVHEKKDILNSENQTDLLLGSEISNLRHLSEKIRDTNTKEIEPIWEQTLKYYKDTPEFDAIMKAFLFTNKQESIGKEKTDKLYLREDKKEIVVSPTRLEKFSRCPFSYFLQYGLRLDERRVFEASRMEIGSLYHAVIMRFSRELSQDGFPLFEQRSLWRSISQEDAFNLIEDLVKDEIEKQSDSVFKVGKAEEYKVKRLTDNCKYAAWALVEHVRAGIIEKSLFEREFKESSDIKPIQINTKSGCVYVEGKIDRIDYLPGNRVKIIDYKTGNEKFNKNEAEQGYRLQLMLYLKAAKEEKMKTAGVFYFIIQQPSVKLPDKALSVSEFREYVESEIRKGFKMNGAMVNDPAVIGSLDNILEKGWSEIVPLQYVVAKDSNGNEITDNGERIYIAKKSENVLSQEEFDELEKTFDNKITEICQNLREGNIDIAPMKTKDTSACSYCEYKGICRFDEIFPGNQYIRI